MPSSAAVEPFSLDIAAQFGLTLRCQRDQRRWSQERLAAAANLNRTYVGELDAVKPWLRCKPRRSWRAHWASS